MTTDMVLTSAIHPAASSGEEHHCREVDSQRWDELWALLAFEVDDDGKLAAVLHEVLEDDDEVVEGIPVVLPPPVSAVADANAVGHTGGSPEENAGPGAGQLVPDPHPVLSPGPESKPMTAQREGDPAGTIISDEIAVDAEGADDPGRIDTKRASSLSFVNPAPEGEADRAGGVPHGGTTPGRTVSVPPESAVNTTETAAEPVIGDDVVGGGSTEENTPEHGPATPGTSESIDPQVTGPGVATAGAGEAQGNGPGISSTPQDEPGAAPGEAWWPGIGVRETTRRPPDSFVHLRVRDEALSTVDIRLRIHGGNLSGRLHTGDDALVKDLSVGLDSLRRHLGQLGYGAVNLDLGTDGRQHADMYRRQDHGAASSRRMTVPAVTGGGDEPRDHQRGLVDVLA